MSKEEELDLKSLTEEINKEFGKGAVTSGDMGFEPSKRTSSGSLGLDIALGGGFADGRIIEIYGPESSGKTTVTIHAMVESQKKKPNKAVGFIDFEHAFDKEYAKKLGLNTDKVIFSQPDNAEMGLNILLKMLKSGKMSMVVIDSVAAMAPKAELEGEVGDKSMGVVARMMAQTLRMCTGEASKQETTVIFINQIRERLNVLFGNPETTTGGNSLKFYASQRIDLRRQVKDAEAKQMQTVKAKVIKNKVSPPFLTAEMRVNFGEGVDKVFEIVDLSEKIGLIKKAGSWFSLNDGTRLGQGLDSVINLMKDNVELMETLEERIRMHFFPHEFTEEQLKEVYGETKDSSQE